MGKIIEMTGYKFNGCEVISRNSLNDDKKATWNCRCFCGNSFVTTGKSIRNGGVKSCGCLRQAVLNKQRNKKIHGETGTRLYNIWRGMKKRCRLPKANGYKYYGAKGIDVCDEWFNSYENFRNWSINNGYSDELTIDRIDVKGDYEPSNCRWIDWKTQERNRSNNVYIIYEGNKMTKSEAAEKIGISLQLLDYRLKNKNDIDTKPSFPQIYFYKGITGTAKEISQKIGVKPNTVNKLGNKIKSEDL